ncbi:MAG: PhoH family protein, partial [Deltaproteobacteria bacterium]|nr:PhoH family protein [Deltaproteobacteria bacterium]
MFGPGSSHLKLIAEELGVQISSRGNEVSVVGALEQVEQAKALLEQLYSLVQRGQEFDEGDVRRAVGAIRGQSSLSVSSIFADRLLVTPEATIKPKGLAQKRYVDAIREHDIVFGVGPAGTGKTYLAMAMAVAALTQNRVKRIILTRPAVEAGEKLGFLPGDLIEKVNPYLRPLYDALHDMLEVDRTEAMLARGQIEVAPLAFMRGRTLNGSFVILDEAQNSTSEQMMMFLTRLGFDSKAVITGDVTQVDLPNGQRSGLSEAVDLLQEIEGIALCPFSDADVVRHPLVKKIIKAYELRRASPRP